MSFRTRLPSFFILIVVVPMAAVGLLVFRLIDDSQTGTADARARQRDRRHGAERVRQRQHGRQPGRSRGGAGHRQPAPGAAQGPSGDDRPRDRPRARGSDDRRGPAADHRRPHGDRSGARARARVEFAPAMDDRGLGADRGRLCAVARRLGHSGGRALGRRHAGVDAARGRPRRAAQPPGHDHDRPGQLSRRHPALHRLSSPSRGGVDPLQRGCQRGWLAGRGSAARGGVNRGLPDPGLLLRAPGLPGAAGPAGALPGGGPAAGQRRLLVSGPHRR
jgi:hypothetical protein